MQKALKFFYFRALHLARLAGIEPTTPWFVAKYSIQLSYSRQALNYSMISWRSLKSAYLFAADSSHRITTKA